MGLIIQCVLLRSCPSFPVGHLLHSYRSFCASQFSLCRKSSCHEGGELGLSLLLSFLYFKSIWKYFYFLIILFIYFGCAGSSLLHRLFSGRGGWGLLSSCGVWVLITVAFLVWSTDSSEHRPQQLWQVASVVAAPRIWSIGSVAVVLSYSSAHPGPGIQPVSPALASRFFTTEPPGKPLKLQKNLQR